MSKQNHPRILAEKRCFLGPAFVLILISIGLGLNLNLSHAQSSKTSGVPEKIVISHNTPLNSTPIYVALEKRYFKPEMGLSLRDSIAGKDALNDVVQEKADIATVADAPFANAAMEGANVSIIATISYTMNSIALVCRKDRGITTPGDLRGKKIGVRLATGGDFFLDSVLIFSGIPTNAVKKVELTPDKLQSSLLGGEVDAVVSWDPFTRELLNTLGANGFTYYGDSTYNRYNWNLAARKDWIGKNPETVRKVIQALIQGANFIKKNPFETQKIVARCSKMNESEVSRIWESTVFRVVLHQSLLLSLEEQARWAIRNQYTAAKVVPNFLNYIYFDGLAAVDPAAVTIAH